jgi:hypothetical protein
LYNSPRLPFSAVRCRGLAIRGWGVGRGSERVA